MGLSVYLRDEGKVGSACELVEGAVDEEGEIVVGLEDGGPRGDEVGDRLGQSNLVLLVDLFVEDDGPEEVHQVL
jgi:hypothetical protein